MSCFAENKNARKNLWHLVLGYTGITVKQSSTCKEIAPFG